MSFTVEQLIDEAHIEALAVGAAALGAGGGGDPYLGKLMVLKAIRQRGPIRLVDPFDLDDDCLVIPTAMMGAPTIMVEKIPAGDEQYRAFRRLERTLGKTAFATMPVESGGLNSTLPFVVASLAGLPVIDADGMGRAFPEMQMESFHIYGISGAPMTLYNERGDCCVVDTLDNYMLEHIARNVCVSMGGVAHIACYAMTGRQVKQAAIPHTVSLAIRLGQHLIEAQLSKSTPLDAIRAATLGTGYGAAVELFRGKVRDVERRTTGGFVRGSVTLDGFDADAGSQLRVEFQNENLVGFRDGQIVASVPDIITLLDLESGRPVTTEGIKYGYRVIAVGIPTPPIMRTDAALAVWGPRAFGYEHDFRPVEQLVHG